MLVDRHLSGSRRNLGCKARILQTESLPTRQLFLWTPTCIRIQETTKTAYRRSWEQSHESAPNQLFGRTPRLTDLGVKAPKPGNGLLAAFIFRFVWAVERIPAVHAVSSVHRPEGVYKVFKPIADVQKEDIQQAR